MHGLPSSAAAYQQKNHLAYQQSTTTIIAAADATKTNFEITPNQPGFSQPVWLRNSKPKQQTIFFLPGREIYIAA